MRRVGLLLTVRPDRVDEYRRLHRPVWPELADVLRAAGVRTYTPWPCPDGTTEFGYLECDDWPATCAARARSPVHGRWQALMADYLVRPPTALLRKRRRRHSSVSVHVVARGWPSASFFASSVHL